MACWSTKAIISLKRVKIEEKLLSRAYRNSPTIFRTVLSLNPYDLLFPMIGGSQLPPKTPIAVISGTGEATDLKFGRNIHCDSQEPSQQKPIKIMEKREHERIQGLPNLFGYLLLSQKQVKLRTSSFVRIFIESIGIKAH